MQIVGYINTYIYILIHRYIHTHARVPEMQGTNLWTCCLHTDIERDYVQVCIERFLLGLCPFSLWAEKVAR